MENNFHRPRIFNLIIFNLGKVRFALQATKGDRALRLGHARDQALQQGQVKGAECYG